MKKVLNTVFIVILACGLLGIILGISVGLYRNEVLASMQASINSDTALDQQTVLEQNGDENTEFAVPVIKENTFLELLIYGNFHTKLLAAGTLFIIISVVILLLNLKKP